MLGKLWWEFARQTGEEGGKCVGKVVLVEKTAYAMARNVASQWVMHVFT